MTPASASTASLLEREDDLAQVAALLAAARAGDGALLVVEGPAGMGKTTLRRRRGGACGRRGHAGPARARRGDGARLRLRRRAPAVRAAARARGSAGARRGRSRARRAAPAELLGLPGAPSSADGAPRRRSVVRDPARPVLAVREPRGAAAAAALVDDAHWADASSLRFLTFLRRAWRSCRSRCWSRCGPRSRARRPTCCALAADTSAARVRARAAQPRRGRPAARRAARAPAPTRSSRPPATTRRAARRSWSSQLARALREHGVAPDRGGRRARARARRARRRPLARRPARRGSAPAAGALARAVAILEAGSIRHAAALAGLDPSAAARAADALAAAAILEPGRPLAFVHPMVRAGVYAAQPAARARDGAPPRGGAARAATAAPRSSSPSTCSRPSRRATRGSSAAPGAGGARRGRARRAGVRRRVPAPRAGRGPAGPSERAALLLELGLAEFSAGEPRARGHLEAACAAAAPGPERVAAATRCWRTCSRGWRSARTRSPRSTTPPRTLEPRRDRELTRHARRDGGGRRPARRRHRRCGRGADARACARAPTPSRRRRATCSARRRSSPRYTNEPADVSARSRCAASPPGRDDPRAGRPAVVQRGDDRARPGAERYRRGRSPCSTPAAAHARATGDAALFAATLSYRAWARAAPGRPASPRRPTRARCSRRASCPRRRCGARWRPRCCVDSLVEQGRLEEAEDGARRERRGGGRHARRPARCCGYARGRLRLAQRRPQEALADLLAARRRARPRRSRASRKCLPSRADIALARLALGDRDGARAAAEEDVRLARAFGAPGALGVALLRGRAGRGGRRGEALLREAVETLGRAGAAVERARAQTELGALLRRVEPPHRGAPRCCVEALDAAHRAGARPLVERPRPSCARPAPSRAASSSPGSSR